MRRILLASCFALVPARAWAFFVDAGYTETLGSGRYHGGTVFVDLGSDFHVKPSYSYYNSDTSEGTWHSISTRLGYDKGPLGLGLTAGMAPKKTGYSTKSAGMDVSFSIGLGGDKDSGKGLGRVTLGAGVLRTFHKDVYEFPGGWRRIAPLQWRYLPARSGTLEATQTDASANVALSAFYNVLSVECTKSYYNRDLGNANAVTRQIVRAAGAGSTIMGFPEFNTYAKLETSVLPVVTPFVTYTHTTYRLQAHSHNYGAGADVEVWKVVATASFEKYRTEGAADQNYYNLGATFKF
ncbi:MAG: hypothetical protein WC728_01915 [Elusimicrobiota bacterium]